MRGQRSHKWDDEAPFPFKKHGILYASPFATVRVLKQVIDDADSYLYISVYTAPSVLPGLWCDISMQISIERPAPTLYLSVIFSFIDHKSLREITHAPKAMMALSH